jgi:membrane protease YdiL (CAAX protease family)
MSHGSDGYRRATRHPWPCLLFLLPLLLAYEGGVYYYGGDNAEALRTGADTWLRWLLHGCGLRALYWPPILITLIFLVWNWFRRRDRPRGLLSILPGMAVESVIFALILWGIGRAQGPVLDGLGVVLAQGSERAAGLAAAITFVGAGIYEELIFRLLLFPLLFRLLLSTEMPLLLAVIFAMVLSAVIFAAAHHIGPYGEPLDGSVFLFRTLAGLYFALLFQLRGFGIAVGTHACYDVLVGVAMA